MERGLLRLVAVGNQSAEDVNEAMNRTAVAGMLDLRDVLELVDDRLNNRTLA